MTLLGGAPPAGQKNQPSSDIVTVNERDFEAEVVQSELPVLMAFFAERNAGWRQVAPELDAFAREVKGKVKVIKIDVEKSPNIARELRIQQLPTFIVFAERRIADAQVGVLSKKALLAMVEPVMPRAEGALKPAELAQAIKEGLVVAVDTRDANAFKRAHLPGATNLPIEEIENRLAELHMLTGQPVLYCRSGDKSKEMAFKLAEQGVPVAFLEGGLLSWEAESLPIER
ncbi:MAG: thioredoxin domain-containing protein [Polyangiaceae bacterium]